MSEQQQTQREIEQHLHRLGRLQSELATWVWLSIFLFWLVFPLGFLIWRKVQYLIELSRLSKKVKDYDLERAFLFQFIGVIVTTVAFFAGWIVMIIGYDALEKWGRRYAEQHPSPHMKRYIEGIKTIKLGLILFPLVIGLFIIPMGMSKAGNAMVAEFGGYSSSAHVQPVQEAPMTTKIPITQEVTGYKAKFCAACGNPVENDLKFCKNCGTPL
ncbi:MAG: zinc ribbon domain-containing protein [Promethearchaeota archaeon]|nr:MAG: zinc ribbon domain-containing protein [Candidatus Lokiarchaeota archaeon]